MERNENEGTYVRMNEISFEMGKKNLTVWDKIQINLS